MDLSYVLSYRDLFYVHQTRNITGPFYVKRPTVYYGTFLCTATPTLHKKPHNKSTQCIKLYPS